MRVDEKRRLEGELGRRRTLDPFRALGIAPGASADAVRAAFLSATKQFHPTRFARLDAETRDLATELFLVIRRAYVELEDDEKRARWTTKLIPTQPAPVTTRAAAAPPTQPPKSSAPPPPTRTVAPAPPPQRVLVRGRKSQQPATQPPPAPRTRPEVAAMLESAKTRTVRFEEAMRLLQQGEFKRAREAFHDLATEDPHSKRVRSHMHLAWGLEHKAEGRSADARRELERGLSIDPDHQELTLELRKLLGKGQDMGKGIFSKLLGR